MLDGRIERSGWHLLAGASVLVMLALTACFGPGEDRPGAVSVDPQSETVSVTGTAAGPGEIKPKPADAVQVSVSLGEWAVIADAATVKAGPVYFLADNIGPNDPHELLIIRTELAPDQLPVVDGRVPEDQIDLIGEIEPFSPGTQAADTFDLTPGNYVLICNIAEVEDGQLESHYQLGMRTRFQAQ
jgi:uncharacterized cupredoxin-like copper-binding protein